MTMSIHEAYNTLGLARDASPEQVKKAYRKLALQFHPDKNSDPAATAKFQQLSAAYKRVDDHLKRPEGGSFEDFFDGAPFDDFDDEDFDLDDDLDMPSMEEMLFMFDMLFGSSPPSAARQGAGKRKKGKKSGPVRVNLRRKGGKRQMPHEPPGFPSYVDQELMDMFARGMMFNGADAGLSDLEDELVTMSSFFAQSGMGFDSEIPTWSEDDEQKPEETQVEMKTEGSLKQTFAAASESNGLEAAASSPEPAIGSKVLIHGKHPGVVKFKGSVHYAKGEFVGIDLSSPLGKNDGSVKGVRYFECSPSHGLMVRPNDVTLAA